MTAALAIFDVCGTLYRENTTVGFLDHYHASVGSRAYERVKRRWTSRRSPFFYLGAAAMRLGLSDVARARLVASLKGAERERLREAARSYAQDVLAEKANAPLHTALERHRAAGDRVVLVSNSLDIVIEAIARSLRVEYRASTLGFTDGVCDGKIAADLTGRKSSVVRLLAEEASPAPALHVYTDNLSDADIVELADFATVVIPRGSSSRHWRRGSFDVIRL